MAGFVVDWARDIRGKTHNGELNADSNFVFDYIFPNFNSINGFFIIFSTQVFVESGFAPKRLPSIKRTTSARISSNIENTQFSHLSDDCLGIKFEYLSLDDLINVSKTCKDLKRSAATFFGKNFITRMRMQLGNIFTDDFRIQINRFSANVRHILVEGKDMRIFAPGRFQSLKEIEFNVESLTHTDRLQLVLNNVETLKFIWCEFESDFHEIFLRHCGELKRLYLKDTEMDPRIIIGRSNDWLYKVYPSLEHFEFISTRKFDQVIDFLRANPKIHTFSTSDNFLIANKEKILSSKLELNVLAVLHGETTMLKTSMNEIVNQLSTLRYQGFFKLLHLYAHSKINLSSYPANLLSVVEVLHILNGLQKVALSPFVNLVKLYIFAANQITDLDNAWSKLRNFEHIFFSFETISNILPFLEHLPKLQKVQIETVKDGLYFSRTKNSISLSTLNQARKKLLNARKVTIFVQEDVYLATKEEFKQDHFDFIDIKRHESDDDSHDFTYTYSRIG